MPVSLITTSTLDKTELLAAPPVVPVSGGVDSSVVVVEYSTQSHIIRNIALFSYGYRKSLLLLYTFRE